ncbi:alpha-L-fucosidase [Streptacidiphilus fuscans]|uniref:alpha-L-fucosidase n=1 Tax=Streptacidiphilus fuscans TaxID=2789292 RepID=A0A931AXL7_9ACTN|nr:alpha-L-fucosidase [Streptacidiphilus fuscans]MBF9066611.1 alpha-L-fucosidase [Streptacidiphilus fuscans]
MAMQPWFPDAKLGIFIHWGIYSVDGVPESWSFWHGTVPHDQYMAQLGRFAAEKYDPQEWARLFAAAGAKYAVLTAKHHDGVALFDTRESDLSVVKRTPAGRDLVRGYVDALRDHGLKAGLYFSHSDWNHPDYPTLRLPDEASGTNRNRYSTAAPGEEDPQRWERFLAFRRAQIRELVTGYQPDLLWFDGEWERTEEQWRMAELADDLRTSAPRTVLNGRALSFGDYATPEQGVPITAPDGPWELCLTVNDSWGFQPQDTNHKPVHQLVRYFTETIAAGGNLLLDVGPRADGTIPAEQVERLQGLGAWIARHGPAVHGTRAGLPPGHHYGPSTVSPDRRTLYLITFDAPRHAVSVRGLRTPVRRVTVLGTGRELAHHTVGGMAEVPGVLWIDAPGAVDLDEHATVLAVELDGELDLYRGHGRG